MNDTGFFTYYEPVRFNTVAKLIKDHSNLYEDIIEEILSYVPDERVSHYKFKLSREIEDRDVVYCYWIMCFEITYFDTFTEFRRYQEETSYIYRHRIPKLALIRWFLQLSESACCARKEQFYELLGNLIMDTSLNVRVLYIHQNWVQLEDIKFYFEHRGDLDYFSGNFFPNPRILDFRSAEELQEHYRFNRNDVVPIQDGEYHYGYYHQIHHSEDDIQALELNEIE